MRQTSGKAFASPSNPARRCGAGDVAVRVRAVLPLTRDAWQQAPSWTRRSGQNECDAELGDALEPVPAAGASDGALDSRTVAVGSYLRCRADRSPACIPSGRIGRGPVGGRWRRQLKGGHVRSETHNTNSIGICLVGNFERTSPTRKQVASLVELLDYLKTSFQIHDFCANKYCRIWCPC